MFVTQRLDHLCDVVNATTAYDLASDVILPEKDLGATESRAVWVDDSPVNGNPDIVMGGGHQSLDHAQLLACEVAGADNAVRDGFIRAKRRA